MKHAQIIGFIGLLFIFISCKSDCKRIEESARLVNTRYQILFEQDSLVFKKLGKMIDSIITDPSNSKKKRVIEYSTKPKEYSDNRINTQNNDLANLLQKLNCKELLINYELGDQSSPLILLYPTDLSEFNVHGSCPYFSVELLYTPNKKTYASNSPNWIYYKLNNNWYLRNSISSL